MRANQYSSVGGAKMREQGNGIGYHPIYKRVKLSVEHCPRCGDQLGGNGSMVLPYRCSCGTREYSYTLSAYVIKALDGSEIK